MFEVCGLGIAVQALVFRAWDIEVGGLGFRFRV